jgi:hypothetical protein
MPADVTEEPVNVTENWDGCCPKTRQCHREIRKMLPKKTGDVTEFSGKCYREFSTYRPKFWENYNYGAYPISRKKVASWLVSVGNK